MLRFKVRKGQRFELTQDVELKGELTDSVTVVPKGSAFYIGCERNHKSAHFRNGKILPLGDDYEIKDEYDIEGIADWIANYLITKTTVAEEFLGFGWAMSEEEEFEYKESVKFFTEVIEEALDEIGL